MAGPDDPRIECDHCGKVYKWKPDLAGKRVKCACGHKIEVPKREDPAEESGTYELNFDDDQEQTNQPAAPPPPPAQADTPKEPASKKPEAKPDKAKAKTQPDAEKTPPKKSENKPPAKAPSGKGRCPSCGNSVKAGVVICLNCGYNLQTGQKIETAVKEGGNTNADTEAGSEAPTGKLSGLGATLTRQKADQDAIAADREKEQTWQEVYVPLILFGVGVFLLLIDVLLFPDGSSRQGLLIYQGVRIVLQLPFVFIALVLTAMLFGSGYGPLLTATLKMLSLVVFSTAIYEVTASVILLLTGGDPVLGFVYLLALGTGAITFFSLAVSFFDMDFIEAVSLYILAFWAPWMVLFLGGIIIATMF